MTLPVLRSVRYVIGLLVLIGVAVVAACMTLVDVVPKRAITPSAMGETSYRVGIYFQANGKLPADMSVLPRRPNYLNRTTDVWDRPLLYSIDSDDTFTLRSLGRDGIPGGKDDDQDVTMKYRIVNGQVEDIP